MLGFGLKFQHLLVSYFDIDAWFGSGSFLAYAVTDSGCVELFAKVLVCSS